MTTKHVSRRTFLHAGWATAIGVSAPTIIPASALGGGQTVPPSERVTLGHIGVGQRGTFLLKAIQGDPSIQSIAVADCFESRRDAAAATIGGKAYADFRHLLDRKDIDGVVIATPDHWHVPIALMAARAGKDVYLEKPMGLSLEQDIVCRQVFHDEHRIFQYGTQQREAKHQQVGREVVRSGKLGRLKAIEVKAPNGGAGGSTAVAPVPPDFDYDMWVGPAAEAAYTADRCKPPGTYWIYNHSIGYLAGWGAHPLDILVWCYDGDQRGPYTVEGSGVLAEKGLYDTVYDWSMRLEMADGVTITFVPGTDSTKFIGTEGRLEVSRSSLRCFPQDLVPTDMPRNDHAANTARHLHVFAESIRSRADASSPVDDAFRSDVMSHLCDIAVRTGEKIEWDPAQRAIIGGSDKARAMATRPMRHPWTL